MIAPISAGQMRYRFSVLRAAKSTDAVYGTSKDWEVVAGQERIPAKIDWPAAKDGANHGVAVTQNRAVLLVRQPLTINTSNRLRLHLPGGDVDATLTASPLPFGIGMIQITVEYLP